MASFLKLEGKYRGCDKVTHDDVVQKLRLELRGSRHALSLVLQPFRFLCSMCNKGGLGTLSCAISVEAGKTPQVLYAIHHNSD